MKKVLTTAVCLAAAVMGGFTANAESTWSGGTDTDWATDANGNYLIYTADELAGLASKVNSGTSYSGYTFLLMDDINLNDIHDWTPIGCLMGQVISSQMNETYYFNGTFDGQGHTVSNIYIYFYSNTHTTQKIRVTSGLFGAINTGVIKNLVVKDSYIYHQTNSYYNYCGGIVAYSKAGTIENCSSINNEIKAVSPYSAFGDRGSAYAGGICGASGDYPTSLTSAGNFSENNNTSISNCTAAGNNVTADGSKVTKPTEISSGASQSGNDVYSSTTEMTADIAAINRATILYNNLGIGSAPETPYYLDETTGQSTGKIYYALVGIDNSQAEAGSVRNNAAIIHNANKMDFDYEGATYALYPAGTSVVAEFYLEGYSGDWTNAGYYVKQITDNNGNVLATSNDATYTMPETGEDENGNPTFSYETGRFLRKQQFTVTMPAAMTTLYYTTEATIPTSVEAVEAATRIYGANGMVVVEAATEGNVLVVDMAGRVVYNGKVREGRNELALDRGFYIANGTKVVVR